MVAKVHESYDAGQFLTGSLVHFDIANAGGIDAKHVVETVGTRATVVILGAGAARIAVENNGAWSAVELAAALDGVTVAEYTDGAYVPGYTVADFAY